MDIESRYDVGNTTFGKNQEQLAHDIVNEVLPHCLAIAELSTWDLLNRTRNDSWSRACKQEEKNIDGPTSEDLAPLFEEEIVLSALEEMNL